MDYQLHYNRLIERAKTRQLDCYVERHHIIPRCMGGNNSKENLAELTPEEHFLAHQLLAKIYPKNKGLNKAVYMMTVSSKFNPRNNKAYGWIKRNYIKSSKDSIPWNKGKTGVYSDEVLEKMRKAAKNRLPPSQEQKQKTSNTLKGTRIGKDNPFYGKTHSEEFKQNLSSKWSGKNNPFYGSSRKGELNPFYGKHPQKYKCVHCVKEVSKNNLTRWHNDNCKQKEEVL